MIVVLNFCEPFYFRKSLVADYSKCFVGYSIMFIDSIAKIIVQSISYWLLKIAQHPFIQ